MKNATMDAMTKKEMKKKLYKECDMYGCQMDVQLCIA